MIEWIVSSGALILMLIMIRWLFRKRLSMQVRYALWLAAALRLLIPVSFSESSLSVLNLVRQLPMSHGQNTVLSGDDNVWGSVSISGSEMQGTTGFDGCGLQDVDGTSGLNQWNGEGTSSSELQNGMEASGLDQWNGEGTASSELQNDMAASGLNQWNGEGTSDSELQNGMEASGLNQWNGEGTSGSELQNGMGTSGLNQWNGEGTSGLELQNGMGISGLNQWNGEETVGLEFQGHLETTGIKLQDSTGSIEGELAPLSAETAGFGTGNGKRMTGFFWLRVVWIFGMFFFFGLVALVNFSYWRCVYRSRRRYQGEKESRLPVYVCTVVRMPCMFGLMHPAIYLAQDTMEEKTLRYVLCHENTHYRHKDNLWTLVRLFCVCIHWFNPLVWLAAYLSKQDCELACDEETVARLGEENRIDYGRTLLSLSVQDGELFGGLRFSTTMSGRKKQLKERLQMIVGKPKKRGASLFMVLLLMPLTVLVTFTGSKTVEAYEENGQAGFHENLEDAFCENEPGSFTSEFRGNDATDLENGFSEDNEDFQNDLRQKNIRNANSTYAIDLNDGKSYMLQVISEPSTESGGYEINQVNLCQADDEAGGVLQSICPGDVKPLYTEALQDDRDTARGDGQQFSFQAEGEPVYAKSLRSIDELSVYARSAFIADGNGTKISPSPDGGILVADLNFDGYEDFCLQIGTENVNQPYYCYLWNPKEERFEHSAMIPNVKVDQETQLIVSATEDGEGQHSVKYYRFDEAGSLHMVRYVEENQSPDALFPFLDLTYHETSYSLPAVDDWDAETEYGGALNERFVYWAKEALRELYEWSGTKVDTACFTVTRFGDFYFGNTPQDLDASRDFYDRTFGAKAGFYDVIESMYLLTERVVWYSSVVQWRVPEQLENMTDSQVVEWYFGRSALTEGEIIETIEKQSETDYVIKAESGNYYVFTLNQATREVRAVYGSYGAYPMH